MSKKSVLKTFKADINEVIRNDGGRDDKTVVNLFKSKNKKSRKSMRMPNIRAIGEFNFLTPNTKKAFNHLWLAFIKPLIF